MAAMRVPISGYTTASSMQKKIVEDKNCKKLSAENFATKNVTGRAVNRLSREGVGVVYFDQQTGAPHAVRWSKSFF